MRKYKCLSNSIFQQGSFFIVPLRYEDRLDILKWRNEQIYHLRQNKPLTVEDQENYFNTIVDKLFDEEQPNQILFSYLENDVCIGYGGLVHINWIDKNAEISFVMKTELEKEFFQLHWVSFLGLIEQLAFEELDLHKIFTYAFDLRPHLYIALEIAGFTMEAVLKEHCLFQGEYRDVVIHSKINFKNEFNKIDKLYLREVNLNDAEILFDWVNEKNVRTNSINQEPILWENHLEWLAKKLNNPDNKILILVSGDNLLGQIRIDMIEGFWNIDYSIDNKFRRKGLGKEIVKQLIDKFESYQFKATVKKENIASIKVFTNLGFKKLQIENDDFDYFEN
jgi:RimJ/RimL family protein N-acetyltransferase